MCLDGHGCTCPSRGDTIGFTRTLVTRLWPLASCLYGNDGGSRSNRAITCAVGGGREGPSFVSTSTTASGAGSEEMGSMIAMTGGIGRGAMYMTACRRLSPLGLHPIYLTLMINVGMMLSSLLRCLATLQDGLSLDSDTRCGFFGCFNVQSNPAALLQSIFRDCFGNFGIIISRLSFFDPLSVSMVMLTEPLGASLIAMAIVHEAPPATTKGHH